MAETAARLAGLHGVDVERARLAGLFHDWARELPDGELVVLASRLGLPPAATPAVLHGPVAARLLPAEEGLVDPEVLAAIDRHTTGDPAMGRLDMVVYLADLLEPAHDFSGVEELRRLAERDLEGAMLAALDLTLRHLIDRSRPIEPRAVLARNTLLARRQAG